MKPNYMVEMLHDSGDRRATFTYTFTEANVIYDMWVEEMADMVGVKSCRLLELGGEEK